MKVKKEVKIGIYAVVIILGMYWVFNYLKGKDIFYSYNTYYVNYDNVNGIVPSSAVYLKGFKIGSVAKIKYEESTQKFCVSLQVDGDYKIPDNSMADIYATDIMGTKAVRILLGDNATPAKSYSYLQASITPDLMSTLTNEFSSIKDNLDKTLANLNTTISSVNNVLTDEVQKKLEASVSDLNKSLKNIAQLTGTLNAKDGHLNNTLENLDAFSASLRDNGENLDAIAGNLVQFTDSLRRADIKSTIDRLNALLAQANDTGGTVGQLLHNDELYLRLSSTLNNLELLIKDLQENPKKYVRLSLF